MSIMKSKRYFSVRQVSVIDEAFMLFFVFIVMFISCLLLYIRVALLLLFWIKEEIILRRKNSTSEYDREPS